MASILVCDSDTRQQQQLQDRLRQQGHKVSLAQDLNEIPEVLQEGEIHLLIMDLDQENLNSLASLGDHCRDVKIVGQTSDPELSYDFRSWIADALVSKYAGEEQINGAIDRLLRPVVPKTTTQPTSKKCGAS